MKLFYSKIFTKQNLFFAIIFFCFSFSIFATTAEYKGENYNIKLVYNKEFSPGDPILVQMQFKFLGKLSKLPNDEKTISGKIRIVDSETDKNLRSSTLFEMDSKKRNHVIYMGMVPTTTWFEENNYKIKIEYNIGEIENNSFTLPLEFKSKEFVEEILVLDQKNSDIKNDYSKERMNQIERLNKILDTNNYWDFTKTNLANFEQPLVCDRRTSFFGDRRTYKYTNEKSSTSLHYGIDYGVKTGTDVFSCGNGKVVMAENRISTGWSICIEHLPGLYSLYYHLDSLKVKTGDEVLTGTYLGKSGATGLATGPHLHWEMRLNMEAINPDFFIETYPTIFLQEKEKFFRQ